MSRIKGAIFDMDGTLIDTEKLYIRFWKQSAADFGYTMTDEIVFGIRSLARKFAEKKLKGILGEDFPYVDVREHRTELLDAYIKEHGIELKSGARELLEFLRRKGVRIAVATATARAKTEKYLEQIGIADYFDAIACGDMVENGKPEPDIYLLASEKLGLAPNECAAFEDSPNGLKSAYRAGCVTVMIPDLSQPDEELLPILSGVYNSLSDAAVLFESEDNQ